MSDNAKVCNRAVLSLSPAQKIVTCESREAALRLGKGSRAPRRAWSERTRHYAGGVLVSPQAKGSALLNKCV